MQEHEPTPEDPPDPSLRLARGRVLRAAFGGLGIVFVVLGLVGIALPVLPTTPFLILAAACFARASRRLYVWLHRSRWFGSVLRDWRDHRAMSTTNKAVAVGSIVVVFSVSIGCFSNTVPTRIGLGVIAVGLLVFLWYIPSRPKL